MKILSRVALVLLVLVAILIAVIAIQPAEFTIERSVGIAAPPAVIQPNLEDLHAFNAWQPFARMDPNMTVRYDGPESGVGASSSWVSEQMGKGRMTITRVESDREGFARGRPDYRSWLSAWSFQRSITAVSRSQPSTEIVAVERA